MNDFDRSELNDLKDRIDLVALFRHHGLELRQVGKNWMARCPFHEDDQASLSVNPEAGLWNCFGCDAGGDALRFLELHQGLDFPRALERLRQLAGECAVEPGTDEKPSRLPGDFSRPEVLERVSVLYAETFKTSPKAQEYLQQRGLGSRELWQAFQVGYADGSLLKTIPAEGPVREALVEVGVLTAKGRELMSGCVVFPLTHPDRGVVGLYGRKLSSRAKVRHLYLPGPKQGVLNWQALQSQEELIVAESVLDALSFWSAGKRNVSCLFGVQSLPRDLAELLGRFGTRQVSLALDADEAGDKATQRFGALLGERGIACHTLELPAGKDPNQLLCELGPDSLKSLTRRPLNSAPASPKKVTGQAEKTGDGFLLKRGALSYRATPRPPFSGRLKVMLCVENEGQKFLDTLDLYSHRARATAINQICRQLGQPRELVEKHFLALLDAAEDWVQQLQEASEQNDATPEAEPMSAAERKQALEFLQRRDLVVQILRDFENLGYVGETNGKLLGYLIGLSRKLGKPLSGIVRSESGAGKSGLTDMVERLTPPEDVVLYSRISAQALGYLPKDFLKGKLLILEERVGGEAADYSIRVLQSRQKLTQAVVMKDPTSGQMKTRHFEVEGPIAYLETTTTARLNHENATRCFEIHLDESEEQTRRIHERQRLARTFQRLEASAEGPAICRLHHNAQRLLEPVKVLIPYVHLLSFPSRWLRTRRDHERFLCLIEASAFLHQHQRRGGQLEANSGPIRYIEASLDDYETAFRLARDVLKATLHELSRNARDLWAELQLLVSREKGDPFQAHFTRRDVRQHTGWPDRRLRETLDELVEMEYVAALAGSQGRAYQYRLLSVDDVPSPLGQLTTPEKLRELCKEAGLA